ncbi:putative nuclease HARBI1 [Schistocerca piceifrons]|uniref:putative nuclease HARBI1 n=1 Tax=Schistocerca piceifrons TaxID=274613 RepID=UPI001F5F2C08|nr:putative nuclease HARBI1 [Schistocerca piceifrons]
MPQCLRNAISAEEKLYLTLRFLATGESYRSLSFAYRISPYYISRVVKNVLKILRIRLLPMLMPPSIESDFRRIEEEFWLKCNIPNCVGAIDGKHVRIRAPE